MLLLSVAAMCTAQCKMVLQPAAADM